MATGRVLQFDQARGYGFVAPDDGGEDVFLHASALDSGTDDLSTGMRIEFKVMAGERGRKAFAARVLGEEDAPEPVPVLTMPDPLQPAEQPAEDQMCDVLTGSELTGELTERLLTDVPDLTGQQILRVRQTVLDIARRHSWSDG